MTRTWLSPNIAGFLSLKVSVLVAVLLLSAAIVPVSAAEIIASDSRADGGNVCSIEPTGSCGQVQPTCIYLFYGQGCPHCERAKPVIDALVKKYPQVQLKTYEVYFNTTNQKMFEDFQQRYAVTEKGVPTLFIGDRALIGETAIRTELEERIIWSASNQEICPANYTKSG